MNTAHTNTKTFPSVCVVIGYNQVLLGDICGILYLFRKRISTDARQAHLQRKSRQIYASLGLFFVRPRHRSLKSVATLRNCIGSHIDRDISISRLNDTIFNLGPGYAKSGVVVLRITSLNELEGLTVT